jgi:hypothetical protein
MIPTYVIMNGGKSITCFDCGLTSWNPYDVIRRYCGVCHKFHDEKEKEARPPGLSAECPALDPFYDWS